MSIEKQEASMVGVTTSKIEELYKEYFNSDSTYQADKQFKQFSMYDDQINIEVSPSVKIEY